MAGTETDARARAGRVASRGVSRRGFIGMAAGAAALALAACGGTDATTTGQASTSAAPSSSSAGATGSLAGTHLTFVGDDAFAPYRYLETQSDGSQKVVGLDIAVADEMASRLGFTYDFEAQEFAATLASVQSSDTSFTMAMSANEEREQTFDFTRGYYEPLVGVLTLGGDPVTTIDDLAGKSIACTTGTVQNKFIEAVMPDADIHTYDGGSQCLQEVLAGRIDAYLCDGAEGLSMRDANDGLVLGLLDRAETQDYVGVYRIMAAKGASFVAAFDECVGEMLADGTIDRFIGQYVGEDFEWGDDTSAAGTATAGVGSSSSAS